MFVVEPLHDDVFEHFKGTYMDFVLTYNIFSFNDSKFYQFSQGWSQGIRSWIDLPAEPLECYSLCLA